MSATGRTPGLRESNPDDFFATPAWATAAILPYVLRGKPGTILDPCCGDGAILAVCQAAGYGIAGIEINAARALTAGERLGRGVALTAADALDVNGAASWIGAALVTNPPYRLAQEFVEAYLAWAKGTERVG